MLFSFVSSILLDTADPNVMLFLLLTSILSFLLFPMFIFVSSSHKEKVEVGSSVFIPILPELETYKLSPSNVSPLTTKSSS